MNSCVLGCQRFVDSPFFVGRDFNTSKIGNLLNAKCEAPKLELFVATGSINRKGVEHRGSVRLVAKVYAFNFMRPRDSKVYSNQFGQSHARFLAVDAVNLLPGRDRRN